MKADEQRFNETVKRMLETPPKPKPPASASKKKNKVHKLEQKGDGSVCK